MGEGEVVVAASVPAPLLEAIEVLWREGRSLGRGWWHALQFGELVKICARLYGATGGRHPIKSEFDLSLLSSGLQNALRHTGAPWFGDATYPSEAEVAQVIHGGFTREKFEVAHLVPLDQAGDIPTLSFGDCCVSALSAQVLSELVGTRRLLRHHQDPTSDIQRFSGFTWLIVREYCSVGSVQSRVLPILSGDWKTIDHVDVHGPIRGSAIDKALFCLILFQWERALDARFDWRAFTVPWIYEVAADPFVSPQRLPSPDSLTWTSDWREDGCGEEIEIERPADIYLDQEKLSGLEDYVRWAWSTWSDVERGVADNKPGCVNPLLSHFMVKAHRDDGIDQFLSHMIAIEAALKLTISDGRVSLGRRAQALTALDDTCEEYEQLFHLRGDYVHGSKMAVQMTREHLFRSRALARDVADKLLRRFADDPTITRKALLQSLHMDSKR